MSGGDSTAAPHAFIDFAASGLPGQPGVRLAFGQPLRVWQAHTPDEVKPVLQAVQREAAEGRWCVGWVAYEAAPAFDAVLPVHAPDGPLAWFAVHEAPLPPVADGLFGEVRAQWQTAGDARRFAADVAHIQQAIAQGRVYQVNHTARWPGELAQGSAWSLFQALHQEQPGGYAAFIDMGDGQVLSVSPELFFDWDGQRILLRPMKGTAPRHAEPQADAALADGLRASVKERAENVMIVDLIRNDVSRVAEPFSVTVPELFGVRALPTVWQMTSDVQAQTRAGVGLVDVFTALFPCGSITGAPKCEAMRLVRELEPDARGVYCGAVGVVRPGGGATFNVAIRTVQARGRSLRLGVGSGITAGAQASAEWQEWRHKRCFAERASEPFDLLETLALQDGRFRFVDEHLARLARSARHFGFACDAQRVRACLAELVEGREQGLWRVRLTLRRDGTPAATAVATEPTAGPVSLVLASEAFEAADSEFVAHKTTRRAHYDAALRPEGFDTVLWNERGELTECTRGNLALCLDGQWLTPAAACGLLPGVGREVALREGRLQEAVLIREHLQRAEALAFLNSLRGWLPATLLG
ncbi:aminodeoxychorismate synthase component I [Hydrogenophaga sp.]|uniref:aminodeoxychorismate synthase component I n=1 Tax=Hydrogenophaga sp. TaxID=1904254 RepID=UPI00391DB051